MTFKVEGVTYNKTGGIAGSCECFLFKYNSTTHVFTQVGGMVTSNATTGAYAFTGLIDNDPAYCVAFFKGGSPDVLDVTNRNLVPVVEAGGGLSVSLNAKSTADTRGSGTTTGNHTNCTVVAGSNRGMLATLTLNGGADESANLVATWGGVPMTLVAKSIAPVVGGGAYEFGLVNPTTGTGPLVITWTGSIIGAQQFYCSAICFNNVLQTGGLTSFPGQTAGNGSASHPATVTVPSATGDMVVEVAQATSGNWTTRTGTDLYNSTALSLNSAACYDVGATSKVMNLDIDSNTDWVAVGVNVKAA